MKTRHWKGIQTWAMAAALLLTACSQDELSSPTEGVEGALPEGEYPLQIGGVSIAAEASEQPWTRVTESTDGQSSVWQAGDEFQVKFNDYDEIGTYRIADDGKTVEAATPLYWKNTAQNGGITAWYTSPAASADGTIDLSNQMDGLAYVMQAKVENASYNNEITLNFKHQLAKVRVVLDGTQASDVTKVEVNNYTQCTHTQGTVTGTQAGWIQMRQIDATTYEANVVPGDITLTNFIQINGQTAAVNEGFPTTLDAANMYTIDFTVGKPVLEDGGKATRL